MVCVFFVFRSIDPSDGTRYTFYQSLSRLLRKRASSLIPPNFLSKPILGHLSNIPDYLSKSELDYATRIIILESQRAHFTVFRLELAHNHRVSSRPLFKLSPFIEIDSVIRVGDRLKHSLLNYDCKHSVLLAKSARLARLIS